MKIFLSHDSNDKEVVEPIGSWLSKNGYEVWIDTWSLTAGDSLIKKIGEGIGSSDKLIVFLSPNSVDSNWVNKEVETGLVMELAKEKGLGEKFVIPALLKKCEIPIMLCTKLYANFTDKPFDAACNELLNGILDTPSGPLDKKLENRIIKHYPVKSLGKGSHALVVEFGVKLSPTTGLHIGIDTGSQYIKVNQWFGPPNNPIVPTFSGETFSNSNTREEPPIYARKFQSPNVEASKSFYLYFESNEAFNIGEVLFLDFYDREP